MEGKKLDQKMKTKLKAKDPFAPPNISASVSQPSLRAGSGPAVIAKATAITISAAQEGGSYCFPVTIRCSRKSCCIAGCEEPRFAALFSPYAGKKLPSQVALLVTLVELLRSYAFLA
ncbi:unnamed protein product [Victoria cruziana]